MQHKILVVDDEADVNDMLVLNLRAAGFQVIAVTDGASALAKARSDLPSLIILDLMLPEMSGLEVCKVLKSEAGTRHIPVIMLTSKAEEVDKIVGLELGADDYVTKPFGLRELLARVRAVLRRNDFGRAASEHEPASGGFRFEGWELDLRAHRLLNPEGATVPLTKGEYALLVAFLNAPGRPLTREHLLQATRVHEDVFDRSIDVQVLRLRRKLEADPSAPRAIQTERGVGYRFSLPVQQY
jgi:two-component system, OmpR family, response regulator